MPNNPIDMDEVAFEEFSTIVASELSQSDQEAFKLFTGPYAVPAMEGLKLSETVTLSDEALARISQKLGKLVSLNPKIAKVVGEGGSGVQWKWEIPNATPERLREILVLLNRPVFLIEDGGPVDRPSSSWASWLPATADFQAIGQAISSVGRVFAGAPYDASAGTGFHVGDGIIVTNQHVAKLFFKIQPPYDRVQINGRDIAATINFVSEHSASQSESDELTISEALYIADYGEPDIAILFCPEAQNLSAIPGFLSDNLDGDLIAAIGFPSDRPGGVADDKRFRDLVFGDGHTQMGIYNVKRIAPGKLEMGLPDPYLKHDCSVVGGNSGSPLISLETGQVVGIHAKAFDMNLGFSSAAIQDVLDSLDSGNT